MLLGMQLQIIFKAAFSVVPYKALSTAPTETYTALNSMPSLKIPTWTSLRICEDHSSITYLPILEHASLVRVAINAVRCR